MYMLLHLAALAATILVLSRVMPDVRIDGAGTAIMVAIVFSVLNVLLGWLIRAFLFVPALLTLGLLFFVMTFIVNTVLLWLTDKMMSTFEITNTRALLLSAGVITLVNWLFHTRRIWLAGNPYGGPPRWI